jgi:hypothetical protein
MATPRLKAEITLPAIQDATLFLVALQDEFDIRPAAFGSPVRSGQTITLDAGFLDQIDSDTLYEWLTTFLGGGATGSISIHLCSHGAGEPENTWTGCKEISAGYEETTA